MNISPAATVQIPYQQTVKTNTEKNESGEIESPVKEERRVRSTIEILRDMPATDMTEDEIQVLLNTPVPGGYYIRPWSLADIYNFAVLESKKFHAAEKLKQMEGIFSDFKKELNSNWPKLAEKTFGFTVADSGRLQVTAPPNTLAPWEEETLNTLLNGTKDLQLLTLQHTKAVIEVVQLDQREFRGKMKLDMSNFHKMIDYGLLLNKGALELGKTDSWLDQLHKNAEKDQTEKKQGLHIEV